MLREIGVLNDLRTASNTVKRKIKFIVFTLKMSSLPEKNEDQIHVLSNENEMFVYYCLQHKSMTSVMIFNDSLNLRSADDGIIEKSFPLLCI